MGCVHGDDLIKAAQDQSDAIVHNAEIAALINGTLALWQRKSHRSIVGMQQDISQRKQDLANYVHAHAKKFWPYEKQVVQDAFSEQPHDPQYAAIASGWRNIAKKEMNAGRSEWINEMHRRCLTPTRCEDARWKREDQRLRTDLTSFADRHAEDRADALDDRRYSRQYTVLGLGHNILNNIISYQHLAGVAGVSAAGMLSQTINSGREALGFFLPNGGNGKPDGWGSGATQKAWQFESEIWNANHSGDGLNGNDLQARMMYHPVSREHLF